MSEISDPLLKETQEEMQEVIEEQAKFDGLTDENRKIKAELDNAKLKTQMTDFQKNKRLIEEMKGDSVLGRTVDTDDMQREVDDRKNAVDFINEDLSKHLILAPHSLAVFAGMTGNGKSTFVAAMAERLVSQGKRVLILSNEEIESDVRSRISCIRTGISFGAYKNNRATQEEVDKVKMDAKEIENLLIVISNTNELDTFRTVNVAGVLETLKEVNGKISLGILDYYQNVTENANGIVEPWNSNNKLASELNNLKNSLSYPIAAFAQCKSINEKENKDNKESIKFENHHPMYRWIGGQRLLVYATDIVELIRDFEKSRTFIYVHKRRFQDTDFKRALVVGFDKKLQKLVEYTTDFEANISVDKVIDKNRISDADRLKNIVKA